jgi:hypothetical protein
MTHPPEPQPVGEPDWDRLRARTATAADALTVLREDQAARWAAAGRLPVEAYRDHLPGLTDEDVLVLIVGEVALRREAGEDPTPAEYQARFPHLADDIAVQFQLLPPEQIGCDPEAMGPRCDVYSLGVILYELLTGRVPFTGTPSEVLQKVLVEEPSSPVAFRPGLDPRLAAACLKAMAKDPRRRFASMGEFVTALDETMTPVPRRPRLTTRRVLLAAAVVALIAGGVVVWQVAGRRDRSPDANPLPAAAAAPHPLTRGSEWAGTFAFRGNPQFRGDVTLKVTDQDGQSFKGVYATEGGRFAWEAVGTAADGAVQWALTKALTDAAQGAGAAGVARVKGTYTDQKLTAVYDDHNSQADIALTRER